MSAQQSAKAITDALQARFGETLRSTKPRRARRARPHRRPQVHRRYLDKPVDPALLRLLCACALSAPSKSDLQQADIVILNKPEQNAIADLIPDQPFIRTAPAFLVFLANGRRLPEISKMRGKPFPNDHLDQFFNAAVDAGIVLATFLAAADAVGLGTCPISVIRDHSREGERHAEAAAAGDSGRRTVRRLAVGEGPHQPAARRSKARCTRDRYDEGNLAERIDAYDRRRAAIHPYKPRDPARWGEVRVLRLVGGQGAAIRRAAARGFRRVRAEEGISAGLTPLGILGEQRRAVRSLRARKRS